MTINKDQLFEAAVLVKFLNGRIAQLSRSVLYHRDEAAKCEQELNRLYTELHRAEQTLISIAMESNNEISHQEVTGPEYRPEIRVRPDDLT